MPPADGSQKLDSWPRADLLGEGRSRLCPKSFLPWLQLFTASDSHQSVALINTGPGLHPLLSTKAWHRVGLSVCCLASVCPRNEATCLCAGPLTSSPVCYQKALHKVPALSSGRTPVCPHSTPSCSNISLPGTLCEAKAPITQVLSLRESSLWLFKDDK